MDTIQWKNENANDQANGNMEAPFTDMAQNVSQSL